jgi:protein TonB
VRLDNVNYPCFFSLSLALHLALVPLLWRQPFSSVSIFEPVAVSLLPEPIAIDRVDGKPAAPPAPAQPRRRAEAARAKALKRAPVPGRTPAPPQPRVIDPPLPPPEPATHAELAPPSIPEALPQPEQASATRGFSPQGEVAILKNDQQREKPITKSDLLPGRRDLLPSQRPIPLNTSDVRYAPYTQHVKQWIESRWEYPDLAKHYGLQGRVVVEFTILQNGQIEFLALVRSSGSKLLDEEAVRAIRAAVPFRPFPRSIQQTSLRIIAGFVYSDQRLLVSGNP